MTLILTIANSSGVYQSSDYQLTINGAPLSDKAGSKQLDASFERLKLQLAFTGVAEIGSERTIDLLSAELKALPYKSNIKEICTALKDRCTAKMRPRRPHDMLTIVVAAGVLGEPFRVATISNFNWKKHPPEAKHHFTITVKPIRKPFAHIAGYRKAVPKPQQDHLDALSREQDKPVSEILNQLAEINKVAANNSSGWISEGCWTTSLAKDDLNLRSTARNVGNREGSVPQLTGSFDISDWIKQNFRAAPGQEIKIVQSAGVIAGSGGATPLPQSEGEPRTFKLTGSSITSPLLSPYGQQCASIEISQLNCEVTARRNEEVTVDFARVQLNDIQSCADFPKPLFPWPHIITELNVDGVRVPRGCEYEVGYWVENGNLHVEIPITSRGIRKLAFLGDEDELVIVVGLVERRFAWSLESGSQSTLQARINWRTRLDGTRG
jgi:hypothetical protein